MTSIASLERGDALAGREPAAAVGLDRVPERARAEPELDPAAAEDVEARDAAREHGGRAQREVGHVRRDPHARRAGGDHRQQRPGVQEARLVRVVLEGHEVQAGELGELGQLDHGVGLLGQRRDEDAELQLVGVVRHADGGYCSARTGLARCTP